MMRMLSTFFSEYTMHWNTAYNGEKRIKIKIIKSRVSNGMLAQGNDDKDWHHVTCLINVTKCPFR